MKKVRISSPELLAEIEEFLALTDMGSTYLGLAAAKNGHIVERLRAGGDVHATTAHLLRAFMAEKRKCYGSVSKKPVATH